MTAPYEARIAARRAELMKQRATRKVADDLPGNLTQRERNAYLAETAALVHQIADFESKAEAWAALPDSDADTTWLGHLNEWRQTLVDQLLTIKSPIRDRDTKERSDRLTFSIRLIDFGMRIAKFPIVDLSSMPLGELMHAAGYVVQGDALHGPRGWRGCIKEVEARIKTIAAERAKAQAALDAVLVTDDERVKREAETQAFYAALATMTIKGNATGDGLVASDLGGEPLPVEKMTEAQRTAFERFVAVASPREAATTLT